MLRLYEPCYAVYRVDLLADEREEVAVTPYWGEALTLLEQPWVLFDDLRRVRFTRVDANGMPLAIVEDLLGRIAVLCVVPRLAAEGYDLAFVALRAEESVKRRLRIRAGRSLGPITECWPLASWSWRDVWAYIVTNDLPYLSLYDARAGLVGYDRARFTTLFDPEFADVGAEAVDNVLHWRWRHDDGGGS